MVDVHTGIYAVGIQRVVKGQLHDLKGQRGVPKCRPPRLRGGEGTVASDGAGKFIVAWAENPAKIGVPESRQHWLKRRGPSVKHMPALGFLVWGSFLPVHMQE